jgi:chromate reductase, NAD(P)H dehydrogenase (quinone)
MRATLGRKAGSLEGSKHLRVLLHAHERPLTVKHACHPTRAVATIDPEHSEVEPRDLAYLDAVAILQMPRQTVHAQGFEHPPPTIPSDANQAKAARRSRKGQTMRILALGGSLRQASTNRALLDEAAALAPADAELDVSLLAIISSLPLFSQDILERDGLPAGVSELKDALRGADGLLIATPEYNWGIPGFLKNAIDWASRPASDIPGVFGDLPVALIGAGGGAGTRFAQNAWLSVFRFLKMRPWFGQSLYVDHARDRFDEHNRLIDEAIREQLLAVITGFAAHCAQLPRVRPS